MFLLSFVVTVAKKSRGKKIGKQMMLDTETWAKDKGFNCVYVKPWDNAAEYFYKKCDYIVDESKQYGVLTSLKKEL